MRLLLAVGALVVLAKYSVGYMSVRDNLYRTVVVAQLLLGDDVRLVAVYVAVDTHNALNNARYGTDVVRYHDDGHIVSKVVE